MTKSIIITQSNYIPWKGYFDAINMVDEFVVYDDMQYTKRDWRNRNKIKTPQGELWLSIPVAVKGKFEQKINETFVAQDNWGEKHWKTISSNYAKSPYFNQYKDQFEEIYLNKELKNLTEINVSFIKLINSILGIQTKVIDSREFELVEGKTERLVDICLKRGADRYYTGPAAKNYMDESLFENKGIEVNYFDYSGYPEYDQLFGEFSHFVTILDLLFNCGPDSTKYLKSF